MFCYQEVKGNRVGIVGLVETLVRRIVKLGAAICLIAVTAVQAEGVKPIRVAAVNTPQFTGLMDFLAKEFQSRHGIPISIYGGNDVYERARAGEADVVISHYGKKELERFVLDGFGSWPRMVFANQAVIIGPKSDPAKIRGLSSSSEALRRIAEARAPFVLNAIPGMTYLFDTAWAAAGHPAKDGWLIETEVSKGRAVKLAEEKQAYVMWGAFPFLRFKGKHNSELEILIASDPTLLRVMAATVVQSDKIGGANSEGAEAFVGFLLEPETQAKIANYRSLGSAERLWWPAARNNALDGGDE